MTTVYEIVVAGPSADWRETIGGREYCLSTNATLYPVSELERVATFFTGRPVYYRHDNGTQPGTRTRIIPAANGRVGHLTRAWWAAEERQIRASLRVTADYWRAEFDRRADRWRWGFSWNVDTQCNQIAGVDLVAAITAVYSVDVEPANYCAFGGRFLDAPGATAEIDAARLEHFTAVQQLRATL